MKIAPPIIVGAWPMAVLLWQHVECYYSIFLLSVEFNKCTGYSRISAQLQCSYRYYVKIHCLDNEIKLLVYLSRSFTIEISSYFSSLSVEFVYNKCTTLVPLESGLIL